MGAKASVELAQQDGDGRMFATVRKNEPVEQAAPMDEEECKSEQPEEKATEPPMTDEEEVKSVDPALVEAAQKLAELGKQLAAGDVSGVAQALSVMAKQFGESEEPPPEPPPEEPSAKADPPMMEEEDEPTQKAGRKMSQARLSKLEKMESELATIHEQLKSLMAEVAGETKAEAEAAEVAKRELVGRSEMAPIVERLVQLETKIEKMSLRRAEPKGADVDATSRVEKRDESSFAAILGLKL